MSRAKVAVLGSTNMDITIKVPQLPVVGETVLGGQWLLSPGGKGANQAVAASRAGAAVAFVSAVGDDEFGAHAVSNLHENGVNTSLLRVLPDAQTGVAIIMVDDQGRNIIAVSPGANALITRSHVDAAESEITGADVLLAQLEVPIESVERAVETARLAGTRVVLNPAPAPTSPLPRKMLAHVDIMIANEIELGQIAVQVGACTGDDAPRAVLDCGVGSIIVTLGERGVRIHTREGTSHIDAHKVHAIDTVGAGDAFCGALACAVAEGQDLASAARFANVAGALATTAVGAQSSIPTRAQITEAIAAGRRRRLQE